MKQPPPGASPELLKELSRRLADEGLLIEAGWLALRASAIPPDAPALQLEETRNAFFAGAQHLFASIMVAMEEDAEPTEADLKRMDNINDELNRFIEEFSARHGLKIPKRQ
jgi:hypothetical protein